MVHIERTALARQRSHREFEEFPGVAELHATAIQGQVFNTAIADHYPSGITVDRQVLHVVQATGQGCEVFQGYIGSAVAIGNDIAH
ncbi:hypothetical protein D3C76_1361990 [compost metagenome]